MSSQLVKSLGLVFKSPPAPQKLPQFHLVNFALKWDFMYFHAEREVTAAVGEGMPWLVGMLFRNCQALAALGRDFVQSRPAPVPCSSRLHRYHRLMVQLTPFHLSFYDSRPLVTARMMF